MAHVASTAIVQLVYSVTAVYPPSRFSAPARSKLDCREIQFRGDRHGSRAVRESVARTINNYLQSEAIVLVIVLFVLTMQTTHKSLPENKNTRFMKIRLSLTCLRSVIQVLHIEVTGITFKLEA